MAEFFDALNDAHRDFIARQPVFFVATAADGARINLSPKGMDCFRVLGDDRVAYLDLNGSGNETQAHLAADGRITIMFCAFDNPALILRIYGRGTFTVAGDPGLCGAGGAFPGAAGRAAGVRGGGRERSDQLRLGRAADDAGGRAADFGQICAAVRARGAAGQGREPDAEHRRLAGAARRRRSAAVPPA